MRHFLTQILRPFSFAMFLLMALSLQPVLAQDRENTGADGFSVKEVYPWYAQPWVWALIVAVVIIFIFAITRGRKEKEYARDFRAGS